MHLPSLQHLMGLQCIEMAAIPLHDALCFHAVVGGLCGSSCYAGKFRHNTGCLVLADATVSTCRSSWNLVKIFGSDTGSRCFKDLHTMALRKGLPEAAMCCGAQLFHQASTCTTGIEAVMQAATQSLAQYCRLQREYCV